MFYCETRLHKFTHFGFVHEENGRYVKMFLGVSASLYNI